MPRDHLIGNLQIAWDSTSLGALKKCPRSYYYSQIRSLRQKHTATPLTFGILIHSALETYDKALATGRTHAESLREAVRAALTQSGEHVEGEWKPWASDDDKRNRETLTRTIVAYLDHWKSDPTRTLILSDGKPAVELSFRFQFPWDHPHGGKYICCGHLDRVCLFGETLYFMDRKTTTATIKSNFFDKFNPDTQMTLYTIATQTVLALPCAGGIIDAIQVGVEINSFQRQPITRTKNQCDEWLEDVQVWFKLAEQFAESNYWPMNDKACYSFGSKCPYSHLCEKSPAVRENYIATDYAYSEWNPLEAR